MTIKLPTYTSLKDSIRPAIDIIAMILSAALGSKLGRVVFHSSDSAWEHAYEFGMVAGLFFLVLINMHSFQERNFTARKYPVWVFLATMVAACLLCGALNLL